MAVPLFIQQVLAITIGMIDTMMVSSAGEAAVSGVSLVNSLDQMLVIIFSSITIGGTVVVSQFFGARDEKAARGSAKQLLYAAVFMACCVTLFSQIFRNDFYALHFLLHHREEAFARTLHPFAVSRIFSAVGNEIIIGKADEMIHPQQIK